MPVAAGARVWQFGFSRLTPVTTRIIFNTRLWASDSGKEQRRAMDNQPRRTLSFGLIAGHDCYREFTREISRYQDSLYALPDWTRRTTTTTVFAGAANTVDVQTLGAWIVAGETLILASMGRFERYTVDSVAGSTITFVENNAGADFPVGSRVYLALPAFFKQEVRARRPIRGVLVSEIEFEVDPTEDWYAEPAAGPQFNGREIFVKPPHRIEPIDHSFIVGTELFDVKYGKVSRHNPVGYSTETYAYTYTSNDEAKVRAIEDVFLRAKGRRGEFYCPTWEHDLESDSTAGAGTNTLIVQGDSVFDAYAFSTVFKAVCVHFTDNTYEFNTVTNITPGSGVSTLTLGANWTRAIDPALVTRISWLPACRFAADELITRWPYNEVGRLRFPIQTLEDSP